MREGPGARAQRNETKRRSEPQPLTFVPPLWSCAVYTGWAEYDQRRQAYAGQPSSATARHARGTLPARNPQDASQDTQAPRHPSCFGSVDCGKPQRQRCVSPRRGGASGL
jgi:hypothetical protein